MKDIHKWHICFCKKEKFRVKKITLLKSMNWKNMYRISSQISELESILTECYSLTLCFMVKGGQSHQYSGIAKKLVSACMGLSPARLPLNLLIVLYKSHFLFCLLSIAMWMILAHWESWERRPIVSFRWTNSDQFKVSTKDADMLILFLAWWLLILLLVPSRWLGVKEMVGRGTRNIPCCSEHLFHCIHTFKITIKTLLPLSILQFQLNTARLTPNTV